MAVKLLFWNVNFTEYIWKLCLFSALRTDAVLLKRARHVITEIQRTQEAANALRKQDFKEVCLL